MRPMIAACCVAIVSLSFVASAEAQVLGTTLGAPGAGPAFLGEATAGSALSTATPTSYVGPAASSPPQPIVLPHSYYVTAPRPARVYVEYGPADRFPFYGRPYGSPNDRWSWYYMGGGPSRYLARYSYPLLR